MSRFGLLLIPLLFFATGVVSCSIIQGQEPEVLLPPVEASSLTAPLPSVMESPTEAPAPPAPPVKIEFKITGETEVLEGEMIALTILYPEGIPCDVDFTPVDEPSFE